MAILIGWYKLEVQEKKDPGKQKLGTKLGKVGHLVRGAVEEDGIDAAALDVRIEDGPPKINSMQLR